jgi:hypothetical protein
MTIQQPLRHLHIAIPACQNQGSVAFLQTSRYVHGEEVVVLNIFESLTLFCVFTSMPGVFKPRLAFHFHSQFGAEFHEPTLRIVN